jgi:hypothetical protein
MEAKNIFLAFNFAATSGGVSSTINGSGIASLIY